MESPTTAHARLATEIERMAEVDQRMRHEAATNGTWDLEIDRRNTIRLKEIIAEIGWPTISKVGQRASAKAWLLAQHADHDLNFQKECLALMTDAVAGDVSPRNIAYLDDRVATHESRPQLYGTQFRTSDDGMLEPYPILEPEKLDERRAKMELEPFAEYQKWADEENAKKGTNGMKDAD